MQSHRAQPLGSFLCELFEHTFPSPHLSTKPKDVHPRARHACPGLLLCCLQYPSLSKLLFLGALLPAHQAQSHASDCPTSHPVLCDLYLLCSLMCDVTEPLTCALCLPWDRNSGTGATSPFLSSGSSTHFSCRVFNELFIELSSP